MAPGVSSIKVYIAPDSFSGSGNYIYPSNSSDSEIFDAMVSGGCKQLSISWNWRPSSIVENDSIFQEMEVEGQSLFAASGDDGSWPNAGYYYPEEDANLTAVGGTHLTTNGADGSWQSETAWFKSGGGISPDDVPIPSYQTIPQFSCSQCSTSYRNVPDVAMEGDNDNYVCAFGSCGGDWGGTSFAAPRWAGFLALANQQATSNGNPSGLGLINTQLYVGGLIPTYDTNFHDITSGDNGSYSAQTGYDLVTGWGSPNGINMINYLTSSPECSVTPQCLGSGNFAEAYVSVSCLNPTLVNTSASLCGLYGSSQCQTNNGTSGYFSRSSALSQGYADGEVSCSLYWCDAGSCTQETLTP